MNRTGETPVPPPPQQKQVWHTLSADEVLATLQTSSQGLSPEEAKRRLERYGLNELTAAEHVSPWRILLSQFQNVLIVILLIATVLSVVVGHAVEAIAIAVIVLFAVLLGFIQEFRAERAIEALRQMAAPLATVIRGGREQQIAAREIVPGDIVLLHAGDKIPADARLLEAVNLKLEEAALTGESVAVEKETEPLTDPEAGVGDRTNMVHAGTAVAYGRGRAVVVATGMHTEFGQIAQMLHTVESRQTPLQQNLAKVGRVLAISALAIVALIVALGIFNEQPFVEMLIFGIALAVAVVPEALPAVVTVSLAIGVQRMVKRNALVRRLPAVETLGSTSVICSDKTGTLTKDEMTIRRVYAANRALDVTGSGYQPSGSFTENEREVELPEVFQELLWGGTLCADARVLHDDEQNRWTVQGDPTEGALVVAAAKAGLKKSELDQQYPRIAEIPFDSDIKRMSTLHKLPDGGRIAYSKGAPEVLLNSCTQIATADGDAPLDDATKQALKDASLAMAEQALRVLAVARRHVRDSSTTLEEASQEMTLLGLVGMIDPPRPEAKDAVEKCKQAGIKVVMITGDHPATAKAVARELGILTHNRVLIGNELSDLSDEELERQVHEIDVFARVSPAHKLRVVTALQQRGFVAAMTGDGVNDAPALKKADIGIAMGITGTDVSKEAAAMIVTDDNFASIVAAVEEGRVIFGNIKKYLMYLLSSNIGEIGLVLGASVAGMPLPLTAVQLLYVNLATDGLPALALAVDPPDPDIMQRPPRDPKRSIFTRPVVTLMGVGGAWSAIANLGVFMWASKSGRSYEEAITMTFVSLVLIQFFKAYNFRSDRHSVFRRPFANKWLNLAIAWELVLLLVVVYLPILHEPFGTYSLPLIDWVIVISVAFTVMPVLEIAKWMERRGWFGELD
jgi:Ca2+-transporting ATPase